MKEIYALIVTYLFSTLSTIGCLMMILYYVHFPKDRAAAHLFCLWLGISGIGLASTTFVYVNDVDNGDFLCIMFPVIEDYFILATSFTTVIIAIRVKSIVFQYEGCLVLSDSQLKKYFGCVWGIPLILVLLPLTTGSYGRNDSDRYCFIKHDRDGKEYENIIAKLWIICSFYAPVLLSVGTVVVLYWQCTRQIKLLQVRHCHCHCTTRYVHMNSKPCRVH